MMSTFYCLLLLTVSISAISQSQNIDIACRDEEGNVVEWYYLYKLPIEHSKAKHTNGLEYLYLTPRTVNDGWKLSKLEISDPNSFPGRTLSKVKANENIALIAYNDEKPDGEVSFNDGHTKGVLSADSQTGFWLIHSVPKYPTIDNYDYPKTGTHYGQSFLCLTLNSNQINVAGKQLLYNEPYIYQAQIPASLSKLYPNLVEVTRQNWPSEPPYWNYEVLKTLNGTAFGSFAKGRNFRKELYEDWIAPTLGADLLVESWRHGPGVLPTNCSRTQQVLNVDTIQMNNFNIEFQSTKDHSKWCVSKDIDTTWICVGDINRAEHQLARGGGSVCQSNKRIAAAYRNLVAGVEPCPKRTIYNRRNELYF